ncbi:MAG TPA: capsular biosynthesis protein [Saprospirales bacterium]|nr:capsular biosynthesis protein [Saprospirales bacterium]
MIFLTAEARRRRGTEGRFSAPLRLCGKKLPKTMFLCFKMTILHKIQRSSMRQANHIWQVLLLFCTFTLSAQTDTLRLIFAGDIMGHAPQITSAQTGKDQYDYTPCFKYVKPILEQADIAIGNLELTLPGKPPYTGYPMFRSPDALATALKKAGFDLLVTANNHSNDAHALGVTHTIDALRKEAFLQTGTFKNERDRSTLYPLMIYKNGFKIALLNYTYDTNGVPTEAPTVVNLIDNEQMAADLAEARARKPHFIIVVMHWGLEYQLTENAVQREQAKFLIKNGADMVIGSHPHVVQPIRMERVSMPDGQEKEALVVYSLGNFISNQQQPNTDGGILFQVDLLKNKGNPKVRLGEHGIIPIWRYIHKNAAGKSTYYALPVSRVERNQKLVPGMPAASQNAMLKYTEGLRKRLKYNELKI